MEDGSGRCRFDRITGEIEKLVGNGGAYEWVKVPVRRSEKPPTIDVPVAVTSNNTKGSIPPALPPVGSTPPRQTGMANLSESKTKSGIKLFDDQGNDVTDAITDFDRKRNEADVAGYENKLSMPHTIQMGDRVTGTILLRNTGERKLKQLEVTLFIPVIGKEKPEVSHFLFTNKPGFVSPPQPGGEALIQKVDIPSPGGSGKAIPELKVTYIRFEE